MANQTPLQAHQNRGIVKRTLNDYKKAINIFDAADQGDLETIQKLLEVEPGLIYKTSDSGFASPLHFAAKSGHIEVAKYLIEKKADINRKTQSSQTSLHLACEKGHINMVKLLLYMGADYTLTNFSKWGAVAVRETPKEVAAAFKQTKIVELIDKYDAHVKNKLKEQEKLDQEKLQQEKRDQEKRDQEKREQEKLEQQVSQEEKQEQNTNPIV